jgi:hypothetical protein
MLIEEPRVGGLHLLLPSFAFVAAGESDFQNAPFHRA